MLGFSRCIAGELRRHRWFPCFSMCLQYSEAPHALLLWHQDSEGKLCRCLWGFSVTQVIQDVYKLRVKWKERVDVRELKRLQQVCEAFVLQLESESLCKASITFNARAYVHFSLLICLQCVVYTGLCQAWNVWHCFHMSPAKFWQLLRLKELMSFFVFFWHECVVLWWRSAHALSFPLFLFFPQLI